NIKFSCETEINSTLPFLDVLIDRSNGFSTSVYRKPTFTGLFTNFDSFIPVTFKHGLVYTLLNRYFKICSSYLVFQSEVTKLRKLFYDNGYPVSFFNNCLKIFLDKISSSSTKASIVPKKVIYFSIPFTGKHSLEIRTKLSKLISSCFPQIELRVIFKSGRRLSSFFKFKDSIPKLMRSNVVYKYTCRCCGASYIGQTQRLLHTRISEHLGVSPLTGKTRSCSSPSSVLSHILSTKHKSSSDDFSIISSCNAPFELLIRESLHIAQSKPSLNENIRSVPLTLF
ncbi:hypothetical protein, partial [Streptococcus pyogenes]|uniref:hypothetical protein n=1 Tax=Streptococcus pyogenes TaxID=1314 RepID=UPI00294B8E8D